VKLLKSKKNSDARELLDNNTEKVDPLKRIEILLWGDKKLGVRGLKGRMERLEKLIVISIILSIIAVYAELVDGGADSTIAQLITALIKILGG